MKPHICPYLFMCLDFSQRIFYYFPCLGYIDITDEGRETEDIYKVSPVHRYISTTLLDIFYVNFLF